MNRFTPNQELRELVAQLCDGDFTPEQAARLEELAIADPAARRYYITYLDLHGTLRRCLTSETSTLETSAGKAINIHPPTVSAESGPLDAIPLDQDYTARSTSLVSPRAPSNAPNPGQPGKCRTRDGRDRRNDPSNATVAGRREDFGWTRALLTQPTPMALTWATFFTLCILIVLGLWPALDRNYAPRQAVGALYRPLGIGSDDWQGRPVARLIRTVDCDWAGAVDWLEDAELMAGQTLELESGRAMVVFYTGASTVLSGPLKVRMISPSEIYLEQGMLVASIPSETVGFQVTTPAVSISYLDLATKFNVSVDEQKEIRAYVERGCVQASPAAAAVNRGPPVVIAEGNGFRLVPGASAVERIAYDDAPFKECRLPSYDPAALHTVAHFRMGDDDPKAEVGQLAPQELVSVDGQLRLIARETPTYVAGAKPDTRAIRFANRDLYAAPCLTRRFDQWILEVVVRPATAAGSGMVFYNGDPSMNGFGIMTADGQWNVLFGLVAILRFDAPVEPNRWTRLAIAYHRGHVRFFVDGKPVGEPASVIHRPPLGMFTIGGHLFEPNPQFFNGDIDEVRLSTFEGQFHLDMLNHD